MSYGECEAEQRRRSQRRLQQRLPAGRRPRASPCSSPPGDEGAASLRCARRTIATHGIGVSGFASTPYNVAVGGTDFGDTYRRHERAPTGARRTSQLTAPPLSYIPEIPWNDSCASALLAGVLWLRARPTERPASATATTAKNYSDHRDRGSGGPSGCATGTPSNRGGRERNVRGLCQAVLAVGLFGQPDRRRARYSRTSRCSRPTASGATTTSFADSHTPLDGRSRLHGCSESTGAARAAHRSRRPSWLGSRRW